MTSSDDFRPNALTKKGICHDDSISAVVGGIDLDVFEDWTCSDIGLFLDYIGINLEISNELKRTLNGKALTKMLDMRVKQSFWCQKLDIDEKYAKKFSEIMEMVRKVSLLNKDRRESILKIRKALDHKALSQQFIKEISKDEKIRKLFNKLLQRGFCSIVDIFGRKLQNNNGKYPYRLNGEKDIEVQNHVQMFPLWVKLYYNGYERILTKLNGHEIFWIKDVAEASIEKLKKLKFDARINACLMDIKEEYKRQNYRKNRKMVRENRKIQSELKDFFDKNDKNKYSGLNNRKLKDYGSLAPEFKCFGCTDVKVESEYELCKGCQIKYTNNMTSNHGYKNPPKKSRNKPTKLRCEGCKKLIQECEKEGHFLTCPRSNIMDNIMSEIDDDDEDDNKSSISRITTMSKQTVYIHNNVSSSDDEDSDIEDGDNESANHSGTDEDVEDENENIEKIGSPENGKHTDKKPCHENEEDRKQQNDETKKTKEFNPLIKCVGIDPENKNININVERWTQNEIVINRSSRIMRSDVLAKPKLYKRQMRAFDRENDTDKEIAKIVNTSKRYDYNRNRLTKSNLKTLDELATLRNIDQVDELHELDELDEDLSNDECDKLNSKPKSKRRLKSKLSSNTKSDILLAKSPQIRSQKRKSKAKRNATISGYPTCKVCDGILTFSCTCP